MYSRVLYKDTYKNQSMGIMRVTSSTGNPTAVKTIAMVTRPADGIPAAPMAAAVDVKLGKKYPGYIMLFTKTKSVESP